MLEAVRVNDYIEVEWSEESYFGENEDPNTYIGIGKVSEITDERITLQHVVYYPHLEFIKAYDYKKSTIYIKNIIKYVKFTML